MNATTKTLEFKVKIGTYVKDEKRDLIITDREYRKRKTKKDSIINEKWYKYTCNICGWNEGWMVESNLLKSKQGCSCCRGFTVVKGINDIATTHPQLVKYFKDIEDTYIHTYGSTNKVLCKCPDCGFEKEMRISNLYQKGFSCSNCNDSVSYPNKFALKMLDQLNIKFKTEYSPYWIGLRRYDFYIPSMNIIIEMDGSFHSKNNNMNGMTKEESKSIDYYKDEQAELHDIEVIRIDSNYGSNDRFKYIKQNILNSKLNKLFNLNNINWDRCNEFALSNLVKIACEYKKNNPNMTTAQIGQLMGGYERHTISRWLKQGNGIWCHYDAKEEQIKSASKNGIKSRKPVEIFKDGVSLGIFPSYQELERRSFEMFGIKLLSGCISRVCTGKNKKYKDFYFKFA